MKKILVDKLQRIVKAKKQLEKKLEVKISNRGKEVYIEGSPENEYIAEKVVDAINFGFPISTAMLIAEEDLEFEILNIKDYTTRKDLERIKGRLIGKGGRTLKTLSDLTECFFEIKENFIAIIGEPEFMKNAQEAAIELIKGSKQGNVYGRLERNRPKPVQDLGLKE